jgi:hypothetical protein
MKSREQGTEIQNPAQAMPSRGFAFFLFPVPYSLFPVLCFAACSKRV